MVNDGVTRIGEKSLGEKSLGEKFFATCPCLQIAVSDMVLVKEFPAEAVADPANWVSCIAGAELKSTYIARLEKAGFADIKITSETPYQFDAEWSSRVHSMAITARKG